MFGEATSWDMAYLNGRIAVVTGASSEIGQEIAYTLAMAGAKVVAGYHRSRAAAAMLVERIGKAGGHAVSCQGDLVQANAIDRLFDAAQEYFGAEADILINVAAKCRATTAAEIHPEEWNEVVQSCLTAAWGCSQRFAGRLGGRRGDIVNISSTAAFAPLPRAHHYVASKGALDALTRSLALELAPYVRVNSVAPGYVATRAHMQLPQADLHAILRKIPLCTMTQPEDVAHTVLFLIASRVPITGQRIVVDGGWSLFHG